MFARKSELPVKECAYCKSRNLEINVRSIEYSDITYSTLNRMSVDILWTPIWAGTISSNFDPFVKHVSYYVKCLGCYSFGDIDSYKQRVEWK